ncbi:hypothetical protein ABW20_dc0102215 [Dactylellina cionopaga]|nr:hypothetical protein ABW20_dc0102215 [Dactylellina cionopaga]
MNSSIKNQWLRTQYVPLNTYEPGVLQAVQELNHIIRYTAENLAKTKKIYQTIEDAALETAISGNLDPGLSKDSPAIQEWVLASMINIRDYLQSAEVHGNNPAWDHPVNAELVRDLEGLRGENVLSYAAVEEIKYKLFNTKFMSNHAPPEDQTNSPIESKNLLLHKSSDVAVALIKQNEALNKILKIKYTPNLFRVVVKDNSHLTIPHRAILRCGKCENNGHISRGCQEGP